MDHRQAPPPLPTIPELPTAQRMLFARILRAVLGIVIGVSIIVIIVFSCIFMYLHQNPAAITHHISAALQTHANIDSSFGDIQVIFFPVPAVAVSDVELRKDELILSIAYATMTPSLWGIVKGSVELGNVTLLRPRLYGTLPTNAVPANAAPPLEPSISMSPPNPVDITENIDETPVKMEDIYAFLKYPGISIPDILHNSHIEIMYGSVDVYDAERHVVGDNIQVRFDVNIFGTASLRIKLGTVALFSEETLLGRADALNLELNNFSAQPDRNLSPFCSLEGHVHIPDVIHDTQFKALFSYAYETNLLLQGQWATRGEMIWHDVPISFAVSGQAQSPIEEGSVQIKNMSINLDKDIVELTATMHDLTNFPPTVEGSLSIEHLSLVRWFGFSRLLTPGLQQAVHHIHGSLDFTLDEQGLDVPRIEAYAAGGHFRGRGGVEYWSEPVIFLDLTAPHLLLRNAYPEAEGQEVAPVTIPYDALTPIPGSADAANMAGPSIGYDINIASQEVEAWKLSIGDVSFRCIPSRLAQGKVQEKSGVFMDFGANKLYGGRAAGTLLLSEDSKGTTLYDITANIRNAAFEKMIQSMGGQRILGGQLFVDASFTSKGSRLGEFLTNPQGNVTARLEKGFFAAKEQKDTPFEQLSLAGHITHSRTKTPAKGALPTTLRYEGTWKGNIQSPDINGSVSIKGPLSFSDSYYSSVHMDNVPGKISLSLSKNLTQLPITLEANINGNVDFHSGDGHVGVRKAQATLTNLANMRILGEAMVFFPKKATESVSCSANIQGKSENLTQILQTLGVDPKSLTDFKVSKSVDVRAGLHYKNHILTVNAINALLDMTKITGEITGDFSNKPLWTFSLHSTLLDIDRFIHAPSSPSHASSSGSGTTAPNAAAKPWSLGWLSKYNAKGTLSIDLVRFATWSFRRVRIPLQLQDSILESKNMSAILYDSTAHIHLKATPSNNSLMLQGGGAVTDMNLHTLSTENSLNPRLSGLGSVWLSVQGVLRQGQGFLPAMDGTWRLNIKKAFLQDYTKAGKQTGSPTHIDVAQAAGTITKGVLGSNNILIKGPDLNITGGGWLNPMKKTLDVNLTVSKPPFTDLPVRYHGALSDPTQSVSTGAAIFNILGNTLGLFGKAIGGVFSVFTRDSD